MCLPNKIARQTKWLIEHHDDKLHFREWPLIKQLELARHPLIEELLQLWQADAYGNIRIHSDGAVGHGKSQTAELVEEMAKKIESQKKLIARLTDGKTIMSITGIKSGPLVGKLTSKIFEQIYLGKIKNLKQLKHYLSTRSVKP
jgi:hypothetical protein